MLRPSLRLLFFGSTVFVSCSTLTKTQVQTINTFATLAAQADDYPGEVLTQVIASRYESQVLTATENADSASPLSYGQLSTLYGRNRNELAAARRIKASVAVVGDYALALQRLSSPDFTKNAGSSADALGKSLDKLTAAIPGLAVAPVGTAISKTLRQVGGRYIGYRQTRALRQYVEQGDSLIEALAGSAESFLQNDASVFIQNLRQDDSTNINSLFKAIRPKAHYERYQLAARGVDLVSKHHQLDELNRQSIRGLRQLRLAHGELKQQLATKQPLSAMGKELTGFYEAIQELRTTYAKVNL